MIQKKRILIGQKNILVRLLTNQEASSVKMVTPITELLLTAKNVFFFRNLLRHPRLDSILADRSRTAPPFV